MQFRPSGEFRGSPVLYRDHRKGPGGPPGGATYPGGPHGLKWEGNQPLVGWCAPLGHPLRLGLETLGGRGAPPDLGGKFPPLAAPPLEIGSLEGRRPLGPLYKEGGGRAAHPSPWRLPLPPQHLSLSLSLAKPCRDSPLLPPPRRRAAVGWSLPQPLPLSLLDQGMGDVIGLYVC